jgi:hypothetical protein
VEALKIAVFATLAAICYGILHDQVTAHACVEYFTIAHPPVFDTESPFLLAIGWGILATWWVGLPFGVLLAIAARVGSARKLGLTDLRCPILRIMAFSALAALLSGSFGALLVARGVLDVPGGWANFIPTEKHVAFSFDAWAHAATYASALFFGTFLVARVAWVRFRLSRIAAAGD